MGSAVGKVLRGHGLRVLTCLKGRSERTRMLAREAQIEAVPTYEELLGQAEMVLSIVVPEEALNTARLVAATMRNTGRHPIYVDCNAVSPGTVRAMAEEITTDRLIRTQWFGPCLSTPLVLSPAAEERALWGKAAAGRMGHPAGRCYIPVAVRSHSVDPSCATAPLTDK